MNKTISLVAGVALLAVGAFILIRGPNVTTRRDVLEVGDVKITADQRQAIPPWAGGVAVAAGIALVVAGARKRA
jgi:hypothetical protein